MARQILVPVDESEQSTEALEYAVREYPDERITALHVVNLDNIPKHGDEGQFDRDEFFRGLKERREGDEEIEALELARQTAAGHGVDIETVLETGQPAETITEYVESADIDHVVMGSHGRSGASRILFGSVAEDVTRHSSVPVTIIR